MICVQRYLIEYNFVEKLRQKVCAVHNHMITPSFHYQFFVSAPHLHRMYLNVTAQRKNKQKTKNTLSQCSDCWRWGGKRSQPVHCGAVAGYVFGGVSFGQYVTRSEEQLHRQRGREGSTHNIHTSTDQTASNKGNTKRRKTDIVITIIKTVTTPYQTTTATTNMYIVNVCISTT